MLDAIGISDAAERVYTELITAEGLTVAEAAQRCRVSARLAGAQLAELETIGLAVRVAGRPVRYRAIAPDVGVSTLIAQREKELRDARAAMQDLAELFHEASRNRHPDSSVEVVHGTPNIARYALRIHEQAQREVRGFDRPPYSRVPGSGLRQERDRLAAGVAYRVIYDAAALSVPGRLENDITHGTAAGERARTKPELPIKLIIADDKLALIPAAVTSHSIDTTFVIHASPMLDALIALFEAEWATATPLPGLEPVSGQHASGAPDAETATLLAMLAAGMTDAAIARSLSWSVRTTQRRMRQLMDDLGATSRFQAGAAARARGWL